MCYMEQLLVHMHSKGKVQQLLLFVAAVIFYQVFFIFLQLAVCG